MYTDNNTTATPTPTTDTPKSRFIVAFKGVERVFLQWPDVADYDALFVTLNQHFPDILLEYKHNYAIQTDDLDICRGIYVDIPRELWRKIGAQISHIRIMDKHLNYVIATDANTTVFVHRPSIIRYEELVELLPYHFPSIDPKSIVVQTNELDFCDGRDVDIPPMLWPLISPQIRNIKVVSRVEY